jgi:hypothetical protein
MRKSTYLTLQEKAASPATMATAKQTDSMTLATKMNWMTDPVAFRMDILWTLM